jgi:hypothetical protein
MTYNRPRRPCRNVEYRRVLAGDIPIDPETGLYIGLEGKVFSGEKEIGGLRGAPCPRCGRGPTHVRAVCSGTMPKLVWTADPRPNCWTPGCNSRLGDEIDREYYDYRVRPDEEFGEWGIKSTGTE